MNNYSNHKGKSDCTESEIRRFSSAYKQAMEPITVSPELRERILRLQDQKVQPRWIKVVRTTACAAACLTIVLAARSWLVTQSQNLSISNESVSSTAAYSLAGSTGSGSAEAGADHETVTTDSGSSAAADQAEPEQAVPEQAAVVPSTQQTDSEETPEQQAVTPKEAPSSAVSEPAQESSRNETDSGKSGSSQAGNGTGSNEAGDSSQTAYSTVTPQETASVTAPASDEPNAADSTDSHMTAQISGNGTSIANPIVSCSSAEEAETLLGWSIVSPDLAGADLSLINGSLFQASWEDGQCYRMARTSEWSADISGDYNQYACSVVQETNRFTLTMKGDAEDAYTLLTWTDDQFSYSWSTSGAGMTQADAESFVQSIVNKS